MTSDPQADHQRKALYEIVRQASYLPVRSPVRVAIERAASDALDLLRDELSLEGAHCDREPIIDVPVGGSCR